MLQPGTRIEKYSIIEKIGAGGMADVYLAKDIVLKRDIAIKILPSEFARDLEHISRFEKEIRNLAALYHPNIVPIYDVGCYDKCHFYAMAYLPKGDLKQRIRDGLPHNRALEIFKQIADALRYAHQQGLIHRDIKPKNILFDIEERPIVTDLGIAKAIGSNTHMTNTGMIVGTPHYMSPEQAQGKQLDHRSDLYSLGVLFYEMLTGSVPYEAEDTFAVGFMHINEPIPKLPLSLSRYQFFIDRLMAKNRENRYTDASEVLSDIAKFELEAIRQEVDDTKQMPLTRWTAKPEMDSPFPTPLQGSRDIRRRRNVWGGIIFLTALALAGIYLFINALPMPRRFNKSAPVASENMARDMTASRSETDVTSPNESEDTPEDPMKDLSDRSKFYRKKEIERLLTLAQKHFNAQHLSIPKGQNAIECYKEVLILDHDNDQALKGLIAVVDKYIELSDKAIEKQKFDQAAQQLLMASKVIPDDDAIISARKRLETAEKESAKNAHEINQPLDQARRKEFETRLAEGRNALTAGDQAQAINAFKKALNIFPQNASARSGLEKAQAMADESNQESTILTPLKMKFVYIKPGSFHMGSPETESERDDDEERHKVILSRGFWLQTTEVTQGQWRAVMDKNPSHFSDCGDECPVENISWQDTQIFIKRLNKREDKLFYFLPSEAQWEYAARAGSDSKFCFGDLDSTLAEFSWYDGNAGGTPHPVATKQSNAWGLYDMHGNVWEWCRDWYGNYATETVTDPIGHLSGHNRIFRGGSWFVDGKKCRSAVRQALSPENRNFYLGVRLAAQLKKNNGGQR